MSFLSALFLLLVGLVGLLMVAAELLTAKRLGGIKQYSRRIEQEMEKRALAGQLAFIPWPSLAIGPLGVRLVCIAIVLAVIVADVLSMTYDGWTYRDVAVFAVHLFAGLVFLACATDHLPEWVRQRWRSRWRSYCRLYLALLDHPMALVALWLVVAASAIAAIAIAGLVLLS